MVEGIGGTGAAKAVKTSEEETFNPMACENSHAWNAALADQQSGEIGNKRSTSYSETMSAPGHALGSESGKRIHPGKNIKPQEAEPESEKREYTTKGAFFNSRLFWWIVLAIVLPMLGSMIAGT